MRRLDRYLLIAVIAISLTSSAIVSANPSNESSGQPMAIIGTVDGAQEEADRLYSLFDEQAKRVVAADERKSNPSSIPGAYLANMHSEAWKAARDANRLSWMGEPAGEDLRIRFEMIQFETNRLCQAYRQSADGNRLLRDAASKLKSQRSKIERIWSYINATKSSEKLSGFQNQMESKGIELRKALAYLTLDEQKQFWSPFESALKRVDAASDHLLRKKYDGTRRTAIRNQTRLATEFTKESERIRAQITARGIATLTPGVEGDAAASFAHVGNLWAKAAAGLNRAIALNWAFTNHQKVVVEPTPVQFQFDAVAELTLLVDAAVVSRQIEDVPQLYCDLLRQIAYLDRRCDPRVKLIEQLEPSMKRLANRDHKFPLRIATYEVATMQPLSWQRRFARQQLRHLSKGVHSTRKLLYSKQTSKPAERPLFTPVQRGPLVAASNSLVAPASILVQETAPILVGASVLGGRLIHLAPTSRTSIVPVRGHAYISTPVPKPTEAQLADLRRMLVVTPSHPPLSFEGASALWSAEDLDYRAVGGTIETVHLESLVTRFVTMPDVASVLIPLGGAAKLTTIAFPRKQICWRLTLKPKWAYHEYFTLQFDPPKNEPLR